MPKSILIAEMKLKLEAPISIKMPIPKYHKSNDWDDFPVAPVGYEEGEPVMSGYIPATTIRGTLRRMIVVPDITAAAEKGRHFSLDKMYGELIGQDAKSEQQTDEVDLLAIKAMREESAVVDLFGRGLGVKSRLMVNNLMPSHPVLPIPFTAVRKDLDDTDGVYESMSPSDQKMFTNRSESNRRRAKAESLLASAKRDEKAAEKKNDKALLKEVKAQVKEAQKLVDKYKAEMGEMTNSTKSIMGHYALPQGLELSGKMVVKDARDRDLNMLIKGLDGLSRWPVLGAHAARGCGEVSGQVTFRKDGEMVKKVSFGGFEPAHVQDF